MTSLAVITARGGSKRIPRKNLRNLLGKPLIAHSILNCLESGLFDQVIVSTDDPEIAEVSRAYGAKTPFIRTNELADDFTPTLPVVQDAIRRSSDALNLEFSEVACVYPTAPLINAQILKTAYRQLTEIKDMGFVFAAVRNSSLAWRSMEISSDGVAKPLYPDAMTMRSQDLAQTYEDAGAFYFGTGLTWLNADSIWARAYACEVPRLLAWDVDEEADFEILELLSKRKVWSGEVI